MRFSLVILSVLFPVCAQAALVEGGEGTLTVYSEAVRKLAPDQVTIAISVQSENPDAKIAKQKHDEKLKKLLELGEEAGIDKAHTSTGYTSLSPQYEWDGSKQRFHTYEAVTSVEFVLTDISHLAQFMQTVVNAGIVDTVNNVVYGLQHEQEEHENTLVEAMDHAYAKASRIAAAAHLAIDKPLVIEEGAEAPHNIGRPVMPMMALGGMAKAGMASQPPELPSGMIEIHETVTVTYQIKPQ